MATAYPYTVTQDSIVVIVNGKPHSVQKGAPNYVALRNALLTEDWDTVSQHLTMKASLEQWAKGKFTVQGEKVYYNGEPLPPQLNERIVAVASAGESPEPLFKFWEKLQKNPSWRSVQQLFPFLRHQGIPITKDGNFIAYKGVRSDYKDKHSGKYDNRPGAVIKEPRNKISDDPNTACHFGLHVGALRYASGFGEVVVMCEVDPENVVCIPYDSNAEKMRVCEYKVIGNHNGEYMPSTIYLGEDVDIEDSGAPLPELNDSSEERASLHVVDDEEEEDEIDEEENGICSRCGDYNAQCRCDDEAEDDDCTLCDQPEDLCECGPRLAAAAADVHQEVVAAVKATEAKKELPPKKKAPAKVKMDKAMKKVHAMGMVDLMKQPIGELRTYAAKGLQIIGASKIPGGKTTLVARILEVRAQYEQADQEK